MNRAFLMITAKEEFAHSCYGENLYDLRSSVKQLPQIISVHII